MANKIISIGSISQQESQEAPSLEVYRDVSMDSQFVTSDFKIQKNVNVEAVRGAIRNIFTWVPGERVLLPEFGSRLHMLLYEGITPQTEEAIAAEIRSCVSEWEPRASIVEIRNISDVSDTEDNTIHVEVVFTIAGLNDEQYSYSFVYNRNAYE